MEGLMIWLKENWKWLLATIGSLGLYAIVKAIIASMRKKKLEGLEEKEDVIIDNAHDIETDGIKDAGEAHTESVKDAHATATAAIKDAEDEREDRKDELEEDPKKLDDAIKGFGITEKK